MNAIKAVEDRSVLFINRFSLKAILFIGFAAVIFLGLTTVLLAEWNAYVAGRAMDTFINVDNKISDFSLKSTTAMTNARRYEKDFLLMYKEFGFYEARSRYISRVLTSLADIKESMNRIRLLTNEPDVVRKTVEVDQAVEQYRIRLLAVVENYGVLGFLDTGLEGAMRGEAHDAESLLERQRDDLLFADLLSMRRREKDFIMRSRDVDVTEFRKAADRFTTDLTASGASPEHKEKLRSHIRAYRTLFESYVRTIEDIRTNKKGFLKSVQTIEPILENLYIGSLAKVAAARGNMEKNARVTGLIKTVSGLLIFIFSLAVAFAVSRSISKSVSENKSFAEQIASGNLEERLTVKGKNEFAVLAIALNEMAESLLRDVTGRKRAEEERARLEDQLRQSQKLEGIGQLAGGIAHDFNNILNAIIGFGGLVQMNLPKDSNLRSYIKEVLAAGQRGAGLTQQILAFSRKQALDIKAVNLNEIISSIEKLLRRLIREDIKITFALSQEALTVLADASQIDQVLINLSVNARDAMPDGGKLSISTAEEVIDDDFISTHGYGAPGRYAIIKVADTGTGMDEKTKERIFEPFFTTKESGKGTGLGLAVVYGIIKQHNGFIGVESEQRNGTTFNIYLPLTKDIIEAAAGDIDDTAASGGTETILIADDDEGMRRSLIRTLEWYGYTVIQSEDGNDAVIKFNENIDSVKLLLLDVMMPNKGGKEAYEEIKKISPDIKVIFMSGHEGDVVRGKGINGDGWEFLSKPVPSDVLLKKVRQMLDESPV